MLRENEQNSIENLVSSCFESINILDPHQLEGVYHALLLCGENSSHASWTNEECIQRSAEIQKRILATLELEDLSSFLTARDSKKQLHGMNLFALLSPKLSKNEWKEQPSTVHCYRWLLRHINSQMGDFLNIVLPVSLNIISDYEVENKVIALECLCHILRNVSSAELNWVLQLDLLKDKLKPLFYYRETDLIRPLIECTFEVVAKENPPFIDVQDLQWGFMDDVLTILLPMMEYEQNIERRCAYSQCLPNIIKWCKISMVKWCPKILRIIDDYSKTPITEVQAMSALDEFTLNCWPFLGDHWKFINVVAGRILYRSDDEKAIEIGERVLHRLRQHLPSESKFISVDHIQRKRKAKAK